MSHFHLLGIGGIGMSALARILLDRGQEVSGTDLLPTPLAQAATLNSDTTVVYSTAIKPSHREFQEAKRLGCRLLHRSELLAELMKGYQVLAVTGTHGKTTTSAMLAWVLEHAGMDPAYALGGMLLERNGRDGRGDYFVLEADESDASHLRCQPHCAVITNVEADHIDYWGSVEKMQESYRQFIDQVEDELFWCAEDPFLQQISPKGTAYSVDRYEQRGFFLYFDWGDYRAIEVAAVGRHNALNACAVFALCLHLGLSEEQIRAGLSSYPGVGRRLEKKGKILGADHYDDYAHHPTEVRATLAGLRQAVGSRRIHVVFQPHRYTRLQLHFDEFAASFSDADQVWITKVWSAGEEPIEGLQLPGKPFDRLSFLRAIEEGDVIVTMGAGKMPPLLTIGLISGGDSPEHEVSVKSAQFVADHLPYEVHHNALDCDVVFPLIHGPNGEDGLVAAVCEWKRTPYVGCDFRSASLCMNKAHAKCVVAEEGIATLPWVTLRPGDPIPDLPPFPVFVKPVHLGSSIGVSKVDSSDALQSALAAAFALDSEVIVEQGIVGRELHFALLGDWVPPPGEVLSHGKFNDFDAKYGPTHFSVAGRADLPEAVIEEGRRLTKQIVAALGCKGMVRIDFFLDLEGRLWFNEANPIPGFSPNSTYPAIFAANGLSAPQLLDQLIRLALHA